jgi:hypothetical protein
VSVANGSMFRGWSREGDGYEHAMLNPYRKTAAREAGTDEVEQGSDVSRVAKPESVLDDQADEMLSQALEVAIRGSRRDEVHP